jgi:hypothetical protein
MPLVGGLMERGLVSGDAPQEAASILSGGDLKCSPQPIESVHNHKNMNSMCHNDGLFCATATLYLSQ